MIELRFYFCGNRWCAHLIHYTPIHEKTISNWTRRCRITNHHVAISIPDREFCAFLCAFSNQTVKLITNHCTAQNRTMDQHFSLTFAISSYIYIYLFFLLLGFASFSIFTFAVTRHSHECCSLFCNNRFFFPIKFGAFTSLFWIHAALWIDASLSVQIK